MDMFVLANNKFERNIKNGLIRMSTFSTFQAKYSISYLKIAKAGFIYIGPGDAVKCIRCTQEFIDWTNEDGLFRKHNITSPRCVSDQEMFGENNTSIVQINNKETETRECVQQQITEQNVNQRSSARDSTTTTFEENTDRSFTARESVTPIPQDNTITSQSLILRDSEQTPATRSDVNGYEALGIAMGTPRFPGFAIPALRLSTYRYWTLAQSPEAMVKAGYFYTGESDLVRCFFCGGGLSNWEEHDDPWVEHAHWFPECQYLIQCKGHEFVETVEDMVRMQNLLEQEDEGQTMRITEEFIASQAYEDILESVAACSLYEMGYCREMVKKAFDLWSKHSDAKPSAKELLTEIFDFEEAKRLAEQEQRNEREMVNSTPHTSNGATNTDSVGSDVLAITTELDSLESIQEENRKLKEMKMCKICMDNDINIVFLPCGHLAACSECAPAMRRCPMCRTNVKGTVRTFLS